MQARLYGLNVSHPTHAVQAMLERKGIDYDYVGLPVGAQPIALRLARFRGRTVPALELDGRRIQGSVAIARALEALRPEPPLYPADRRDAVQEAEVWAEREFQPLPRRFFRWGLAHRPEVRAWVAREVMGGPAVAGTALIPMARYFARLSRADDEFTREGVRRLPAALEHVDALLAAGTIGVPGEPTAADFQIASTVAVLRGFSDLLPWVEGRPAAVLAERLFPRPVRPLPPFLPEEWLAAARS